MNTCKNCKHWKRVPAGFETDYHGPHAGNCNHDAFVYDGKKVGASELHYWDHEGYSAGFLTGEDFGCVHHAT
jgi:hypothetical protein